MPDCIRCGARTGPGRAVCKTCKLAEQFGLEVPAVEPVRRKRSEVELGKVRALIEKHGEQEIVDQLGLELDGGFGEAMDRRMLAKAAELTPRRKRSEVSVPTGGAPQLAPPKADTRPPPVGAPIEVDPRTLAPNGKQTWPEHLGRGLSAVETELMWAGKLREHLYARKTYPRPSRCVGWFEVARGEYAHHPEWPWPESG